MRVLFVSHDPVPGPEPRGLGFLARTLVSQGHDVTVLAPGDAPLADVHTVRPSPVGPKWLQGSQGGGRAEGRLTALATAQALRRRPDVAHVTLAPGTWGVPTSLSTLGVPVVLELRAPLFEDLDPGIRREWIRHSLRSAARSARAIVVTRPDLDAHLRDELGIRGARVLEEGADLEALTPMERAEAKRELGLMEATRFMALVSSLEDEVRLDLLAFAQRKLPGVGLLVVGEGPGETHVEAMRFATRPSSPVIRLQDHPRAQRLAIAASELGLALRSDRAGPETVAYAAMGRRQVNLSTEAEQRIHALFPDLQAVVAPARRGMELDAAGLQRATEACLRVEQQMGPLPPERVEAARSELGRGSRVEQLLDTYRACIGP